MLLGFKKTQNEPQIFNLIRYSKQYDVVYFRDWMVLTIKIIHFIPRLGILYLQFY